MFIEILIMQIISTKDAIYPKFVCADDTNLELAVCSSFSVRKRVSFH